jgi:hypothetical protein
MGWEVLQGYVEANRFTMAEVLQGRPVQRDLPPEWRKMLRRPASESLSARVDP